MTEAVRVPATVSTGDHVLFEVHDDGWYEGEVIADEHPAHVTVQFTNALTLRAWPEPSPDERLVPRAAIREVLE